MTIFRSDRHARVGGGTALYVRQSIRCHAVNDPTLNSLPESTWVKIKGDKRDILVGVIYRPPAAHTEYDTLFLRVLSHLDRFQQNSIVLLGDFNIPDFNTIIVSDENLSQSMSSRLYMAFLMAGLQQLVEEPTRWAPDGRSSMLDLIFANEDNLVSGIQTSSTLGRSDHCCLSFLLHKGSHISTTGGKRWSRIFIRPI